MDQVGTKQTFDQFAAELKVVHEKYSYVSQSGMYERMKAGHLTRREYELYMVLWQYVKDRFGVDKAGTTTAEIERGDK